MNIRKLILLLSLFIVLCANAQPVVYKKAAHDLTPFTGTWTALKDDMKYEDSDTGKVIEVDFDFLSTEPFATIPISVYHKIELELKKNT